MKFEIKVGKAEAFGATPESALNYWRFPATSSHELLLNFPPCHIFLFFSSLASSTTEHETSNAVQHNVGRLLDRSTQSVA
jgi:hypothetical protein